MSESNPTKREFELLDRIHRLKMENNDLLNRLAREAPDAWQDYNSIKHYQRENAELRAVIKEQIEELRRLAEKLDYRHEST